jgi:oligopeptide/dipeptide ABC transporter ATP-binding protein
MAMIFISHDLAVVREISHRVMVLYLGRVMEEAPTGSLFSQPHHPYTRALLASALIPDPELERLRKRVSLSGEVASPLDPLAGLQFLKSRLPLSETDPIYVPQLVQIAPGHLVAEYDPA